MFWLALKHSPDPPPFGTGAGAGAVADSGTAPPADIPDIPDIPGSMGSTDSTWLGLWALQFSPRVAWVEEAWLLEASTTLRLWGGPSGLIRQVRERFACLGLPGQLQCHPAPSALAALASWRTGTHLAPPTWHLGTLPLHALSAARPHVQVFGRLGLFTWEQLERLPRQGVARRWGPGLLQALDQALGKAPEKHRWLQAPPVFDQAVECPFALETVARLMPAVRQLLAALQGWLVQQQRGALALRWQWTHDTRRDTPTHGTLELHTAHPTQAVAHWQRLTEEHLGRVQLAAPVLALRLCTLAHAPCPEQHTDWLAPHAATEGGPGHGWAELLERLAARLGPQAVVRWQPEASHWPQNQQRARPAAPGTSTPGGPTPGMAVPPHCGTSEPTWLVHRPLALPMAGHRPHHHGPLELLAGPHRLEWIHWPSQGTAGPASPSPPGTAHTQPAPPTPHTPRTLPMPVAEYRDYFVARSPQAGLLWVYRCVPTASPPASAPASDATPEADAPPGAQWFLHGCFA